MDGSVDLSGYHHLMMVPGIGVCAGESRIPVVEIAGLLAEGFVPADLAAKLGVPTEAIAEAARYSRKVSSFADLEPVRFAGTITVTPPGEPKPNP